MSPEPKISAIQIVLDDEEKLTEDYAYNVPRGGQMKILNNTFIKRHEPKKALRFSQGLGLAN